jgi:hypothetical protein
MGFTATDTVSCRLLPEQIATLRELAARNRVSLCRFVGGLCLSAIQGRKPIHTQIPSSASQESPVTRKDELEG